MRSVLIEMNDMSKKIHFHTKIFYSHCINFYMKSNLVEEKREITLLVTYCFRTFFRT